MPNAFQFVRAALQFTVGGRPVPQPLAKAGAQATISETRARMFAATLKLQQGSGDVNAWRAEMQSAIKLLHIANTALARGGFSHMRPSDYAAQAPKIADQYGYLEGFAYDIARGRYGAPEALREAVLSRAAQYAERGRAIYENERTAAHTEAGYAFATRVLAASDHCDVCQAEGGVKRPIDEVVEIGDSPCGNRCWCVLIYSRD